MSETTLYTLEIYRAVDLEGNRILNEALAALIIWELSFFRTCRDGICRYLQHMTPFGSISFLVTSWLLNLCISQGFYGKVKWICTKKRN